MTMNIIMRFIRRMRFRKGIKSDEGVNVVDGMVRARKLYKELSLQAHPDRNPANKGKAEELMQRIIANRFNYAALLELKKEMEELNLNK